MSLCVCTLQVIVIGVNMMMCVVFAWDCIHYDIVTHFLI